MSCPAADIMYSAIQAAFLAPQNHLGGLLYKRNSVVNYGHPHIMAGDNTQKS